MDIIKSMKGNAIEKLLYKLSRVQLNFKRMHITLVGDEGRRWRVMLYVAAGAAVAAAVLLFAGSERQLLSSSEVKAIVEKGVLSVGVRSDAGEMSSPESGLERELAERLAQRILPKSDISNSLKLEDVTSMTAGAKLDDGTADVVIAMMSRGMAPSYYYSESYLTDDCVLVVPAGKSSFTMERITVGHVQSNVLRTSVEETLLNNYIAENESAGLTAVPYAAYEDMLSDLEKGELDSAVMTGLYLKKYHDQYDIVGTSLVLGQVNYSVMCRSDASVLADIATIMIREMKNSGELAALYQKYGLE